MARGLTPSRVVAPLCLVVCALAAPHGVPAAAHRTPTVETDCGVAKGAMVNVTVSPEGHDGAAVTTTMAAFLGLPFAEAARFELPRRAACWPHGTVFQATSEPPACPQWRGDLPPPQGESEDCLFVDVYATRWPPAARFDDAAAGVPVLVWLYGGGNVDGYTNSYGPVHQLAALWRAEQGEDAIVVAPNFRLGAFGYLALQELSKADPRDTSGNYGIADTVEALRWVQRNAAAFGGDPSRVTILGQSSGGTNVLALLGAPAAAGLFHAAVSLSGSPNVTMGLPQAEAQGRALVEATTCAGQSGSGLLACLRALPVDAIKAATPESWSTFDDMPSSPTQAAFGGLVIADGATVAGPLPESIAAGYTNATVLVQTCAAEDDVDPNSTYTGWSPTDFVSFVQQRLAPFGSDAADAVAAEYKPIADARGAAFAMYALTADVGNACGSVVLAKSGAARPAGAGPTYLGLVTQGPSHPFLLSSYPFHSE